MQPDMGPLTGGPKYCMSNIRNDKVPCHYLFNFDFDCKMILCCMSNLRNGSCHVVNISSHVHGWASCRRSI